ncbi:hypothetical protein K458DRAFT_370346 [Lentithecium fluviatile CBS 122367]|uniref:F-box domain-containing protein n=1 Tax=Lentithecium fluviatile CBS 122367 TaxID=1168545 RepID=A0A6G1IX02_9PLEO|nr:hypothetical protein K458DRAFT_370346 [Lentithecium fluviatile CBS 122367]
MEGPSAGSSDPTPDTASSHRKCRRHLSDVTTKCNATNDSEQRCSRPAKIFRDGQLPVCTPHRYKKLDSARCQAIEACGQPCFRLARLDPPFHLCSIHEKGTDTLPCHLLRIPVELRLMVFRYILPAKVESAYHSRTHEKDIDTTVLKLNRQLHSEASSVLYGETLFHATVGYWGIYFMTKKWFKDEPSLYQNYRGSFNDPASTFPPTVAKRICNLNIAVEFRQGPMTDYTMKRFPEEEVTIISARDAVRKFVDLISNENTRKQLRVTPDFKGSRKLWEMPKLIAAIHLDPTVDASAYIAYQREWAQQLRRPGSRLTSHSRKLSERQEMAKVALARIEDFLGVVARWGLATKNKTFPSGGSAFGGIGPALHLARVAFEHADLETLSSIREAIVKRWVNYHRRIQNDSRMIADKISELFTPVDDPRDLAQEYPEAFGLQTFGLVESPPKGCSWSDIEVKDDIPDLDDPEVITWVDRERRYIHKGGKEWMRLMYPSLVSLQSQFP